MLYIGTSGWNYAHWREKFYPQKLKPSDFLKFYSKHFKTAEVNYSFYRLPKTSTYQNWYNQTPKKFIFAVKASRFITHIKRLKNTKAALKIFLENASSLKEKLGPILFQFPPSFQATEENIKRLESFLEIGLPPLPFRTRIFRLQRSEFLFPRPDGSDFVGDQARRGCGIFFKARRKSLKASLVGKWAFEFRHSSWCNEKIYKLLQKYNVAWVIADSPSYPKAEVITADFIYIRMHAPTPQRALASHFGARGAGARLVWGHGSKILFGSKYTKQELKDLTQKIKKWQKKVKDIYIYFNNDFSGFAVENAKQLYKMLDVKNKKAP